MNILIIGSEGFIGRNCLNFFSERNNLVYGCDIINQSVPNYFFVSAGKPNYDLIIEQVLPDVCINTSGSTGVNFSLENPEKDFNMNVRNVELLLEAIKKYCHDCKFINISSAAVYGNPKTLPLSETAETHPLSIYGRHKLQSELLLKEYHDKYKMNVCSLRVFSAYGVGLRKQLFWDIYQKSLLGSDILLFGTGNESRDFIYIDDLVRAVQCVVRKGSFTGDVINVSSGVETYVKDAARLFLSLLGDDFIARFTGEEKPADPKNWKADISLLKKMGFKPFVTFEDGIKKYTKWLKESE